MSKANMKKAGFYILMMHLGLQLSGCDTIAPLLKFEKYAPSKLENPKQAKQIPQKIDNIAERNKAIYGLLEDAQNAFNNDKFDEAQKYYQTLSEYDPGNLKAKQGMNNLASARVHAKLIEQAEAVVAEANEKNKLEKLEAGLAKLNSVLLESPRHKKGYALYQAWTGEQATLLKNKVPKKLAYNQPVTMEFRDVSLKMVFEALSKATQINFILDKDIPSEDKATIFVKAMAFSDALDLLLQTNKLEKKVLSDNSAIIYMNDVIHQKDYKDLSVRSYTLDYADAKQMTVILRSMLNINSIEIDTRLNTILIKDSPEILNLAEKIIYAQDKPDPEVMLELQVMEVKRSYLQKLGMQTPTGLTVPVPTGGLTIKDLNSVTSNSLVVNGVPGLIFSTSNGDVDLLANPRIRVKHKEIAKIHIGEKVPVFTSNVAATGVTSETIQYIDAGLKLEVEPSISSTDDITIKVNLNVGSIGDTVTSSTGGSAFRVGTRFTSTQLRLHDGETQVLAGLIDDQDRKNVSGIAGLASMPLLGRLFSNQTDDKSKTEIVLSITPHIVRPRSPQLPHEAEVWLGSEQQFGKRPPSPAMMKGLVPFTVPKPAKATPTPTSEKIEAPANLNIPLPSGFSLGGGLNSLDTKANKEQ